MSDVSAVGAGIVHKGQFTLGLKGLLAFQWDCLKIEMQCSVIRTSLERERKGGIALTVYHSGLVFIPTASAVESRTQALVAEAVAAAIQHQKANAFAVSLEKAREMSDIIFIDDSSPTASPSVNLNSFFAPLTGGAGIYVCCSLQGHSWSMKTVTTPDQPDEGFTVSGHEPHDEIETLCLTYQNADPDGRKLIRTFAHLTLAEPGDTPRDLYRTE